MRTCIAHDGEVDSEWRPVKNGVLYMAGHRRCGLKDCVNPKHITPDRDKVLEAERWSIWYRNKKQQSYEELIAQLERERLCSTRTNAGPALIEWLLREPLPPRKENQSA